jgi:hypothetical protein
LHDLDHDLAVAEDEGVDDPIQIAGDQHRTDPLLAGPAGADQTST